MKNRLFCILVWFVLLQFAGCTPNDGQDIAAVGPEIGASSAIETDTAGTQEIEPSKLTGYFLRLEDGRCILVLDERNPTQSGSQYLVLYNPPWLTPVDMDAFRNGDHVAAVGLTIAELTPPVFDISGLELLASGTIDNIPPEILEELVG